MIVDLTDNDRRLLAYCIYAGAQESQITDQEADHLTALLDIDADDVD